MVHTECSHHPQDDGGTVRVRDASSVGSLDTLHATDGLVDTIPGTYRYVLHLMHAYGMYLVLGHWIHYTLQMGSIPRRHGVYLHVGVAQEE